MGYQRPDHSNDAHPLDQLAENEAPVTRGEWSWLVSEMLDLVANQREIRADVDRLLGATATALELLTDENGDGA